jgi:hypothetical protein
MRASLELVLQPAKSSFRLLTGDDGRGAGREQVTGPRRGVRLRGSVATKRVAVGQRPGRWSLLPTAEGIDGDRPELLTDLEHHLLARLGAEHVVRAVRVLADLGYLTAESLALTAAVTSVGSVPVTAAS